MFSDFSGEKYSQERGGGEFMEGMDFDFGIHNSLSMGREHESSINHHYQI